MAVEVLYSFAEALMICPACNSENEMAYSILIHGFVCMESKCGLELEMEHIDVEKLLGIVELETVYA